MYIYTVYNMIAQSCKAVACQGGISHSSSLPSCDSLREAAVRDHACFSLARNQLECKLSHALYEVL